MASFHQLLSSDKSCVLLVPDKELELEKFKPDSGVPALLSGFQVYPNNIHTKEA